ncbi:MAG: hypothetical protein SPI35_05890 [Porphyromonas sp.]|nr:hypothetical protein [Porphyromonas sp.]
MELVKELFGSVARLRDFAPGIELAGDLSEYEAQAHLSKREVERMVPGVWNSVISLAGDSPVRLCLLSALANHIMSKMVTFSAVANRKNGSGDIFKYEVESMRRTYQDNYYNSLGDLLFSLQSEPPLQSLWADSQWGRLLASAEIKTTMEFNSLFPIDFSHLFFFRSLVLQQEILMMGMANIFARVRKAEAQDPEREQYGASLSRLRLALAKRVVAMAMERFDPIELPTPIRNFFDDNNSSRSFGDVATLIAKFRQDADSIVSSVETVLSKGQGIVAATHFKKDDKIVFLA